MRQYRPLGTVATPADWPLPATTRFVIEALYADFDGSGAAGAYLPTVEIVSDAGDTVVIVPQDASVASGSSVGASWAPFLRKATTGGGGTALRSFYERADAPNATGTTSGVARILDFGRDSSNDASNVALNFGPLTGASNQHTIILVKGDDTFVYAWTLRFAWASFAGTRSVTVDVTDNAGASQGELGYPVVVQGADATGDQYQNAAGIVVPTFASYPAYLTVTALQSSGANQSFGSGAGLGYTSLMVEAQETS